MNFRKLPYFISKFGQLKRKSILVEEKDESELKNSTTIISFLIKLKNQIKNSKEESLKRNLSSQIS